MLKHVPSWFPDTEFKWKEKDLRRYSEETLESLFKYSKRRLYVAANVSGWDDAACSCQAAGVSVAPLVRTVSSQ